MAEKISGSPQRKKGDRGKNLLMRPEINTPVMKCSIYRENGMLYFSSNAHIGMGGLDIFMAQKDEKGKWIIENMNRQSIQPAMICHLILR